MRTPTTRRPRPAAADRATGLTSAPRSAASVIGLLLPAVRDPAHPPEPGARPGPGGVRRYPADRERRGRGAPAAAAPPGAHAQATAAVVLNRNNSADRLEAVTPLPAGSPLARTLRGAEPRSCLAVRSGRAHPRTGGGRPCCPARCAVPVPGASSCVPLMVGGEVIGSVLLCRPAALLRGRGTADPRVGRPGRAGAGEPAQPGRRGDPRRDRRPDRAAQQAGRHGRAEADVRAGHDDQGAARAAPARPGPLQAGQRPARARGGGSGPGGRRRGAARRAAGPGLRRAQRRGGVRGPAARHR